jgi:hypothetical protein
MPLPHPERVMGLTRAPASPRSPAVHELAGAQPGQSGSLIGSSVQAGLCALSRTVPVTQRHTIDRHHLEANLRCSAAWTGLLEARGSLVEVLVEAASRGGTGCIMLELPHDHLHIKQMRMVPLHRSDGIARPSA